MEGIVMPSMVILAVISQSSSGPWESAGDDSRQRQAAATAGAA